MFLRFVITSFIILSSIGINAQRHSKIVSPIKVGAIPGVELFRRLNIYDVMYDSLKKSMHQEFQTEAKKYSDSLQLLQTQVDSIFLVHFKVPTTMMRSLNRSRYELVNFQNGILQQDIQDQETLRDIGTYCRCQLTGDFRSAQYNPGLAQDDYSDKKMDTMITKARIHFTCNVYDNPAYKEYFEFLNLFTPQ